MLVCPDKEGGMICKLLAAVYMALFMMLASAGLDGRPLDFTILLFGLGILILAIYFFAMYISEVSLKGE